MAKQKSTFICQNCGAQSAKWLGKCPACGQWNTIVEEVIRKEGDQKAWQNRDMIPKSMAPRKIADIDYTKQKRLISGDGELDRVLGGGIVAGSVVLIGGEPGIGKSTLMLQLAMRLTNVKVLYVSGEESEQQIKMRADRLGKASEMAYILADTSLDDIFAQVSQMEPDLMIIDSIQTLQSSRIESTAGSVSQVRECTSDLIRFAKESGVPVFLVGHITKEGSLAGPKVLEHMVDTVLTFEGDRHLTYRLLRTTKNRFGSTSELGIYEMQGSGLRQVDNPSEILISQKEHDLGGAAIGATLEGNRPLLIEIQSLVSPATYGTPQRSSTGFDSRRLNMLLAILEKRGGFRLGTQDVFLNIAGGIRVEDPAIDLAVCLSLVSSLHDSAIHSRTCFAGEIGLGGEIRAVNRIDQRISEAEKLGFERMYISRYNLKGLAKKPAGIEIKAYGRLVEVIDDLIG